MDLLGFLFAILPIALSPGASFTLALSAVPLSGFKGASKVIIGTTLGILTHAILVGVGVSAIIIKNHYAMTALNVFGVLFLLWLGIKLLLNGIKAMRHKSRIQTKDTSIKEAFMLNIFNVKAILLYLTVVPIFVGSVGSASKQFTNYLILSGIHIAIMGVWILVCSGLLMLAGNRFELNKIASVINTVGGLFLIVTAGRYGLDYYRLMV